MEMSIRPENPYWIPRNRYYELKHFCLQYPVWDKAYHSLRSLAKRPDDLAIFVQTGQVKSDPLARCYESQLIFGKRMRLVEQAALKSDPDLSTYLLEAVTEGLSYEELAAKYEIPCCKKIFMNAYQRFFWLLSKSRQ